VLELPFPAKILWPNGRGHHMAKHREFQKHKRWASAAALACRSMLPARPTRLVFTIYPKTANRIDADNAVAAMKAYQDGICAALKVDDGTLCAPRIIFGEPVKGGMVVVVVEGA